MEVSSIFTLIRPHQYIKNLFIFLPLFFAARITDAALFLSAVVAFLAFSLAASAIYILNDYQDIEDDKLHLKKKTRPLAAGVITIPQALSIMTILFIAGITLMASVSFTAMNILFVYLALNIAYSFYLKHVAILDVMIIAIGFVLRVFVGSAVTDIPLSMWMLS